MPFIQISVPRATFSENVKHWKLSKTTPRTYLQNLSFWRGRPQAYRKKKQ